MRNHKIIKSGVYNKQELKYIHQQYEQFTNSLKTIPDYEIELQRALKELHYIHDLIFDKKSYRYRRGFSNEFALERFLISRIKNCRIRINQLKQIKK